MNWEKIPCRHCGMKFENLQDRDEHERCHIASCSVQACCRLEGHEGNHWCSVCNVRDLAGVEFFEHECFDGPLFDDKDDGIFVMDSVAKELLTGAVEDDRS